MPRHSYRSGRTSALLLVLLDIIAELGIHERLITSEADSRALLEAGQPRLADALAAATAEQGRVERGKATMELDLAWGRPEMAPQTPLTVAGFKPEIDATPWLVVKLTHSLGDGGLTTRMELETRREADK